MGSYHPLQATNYHQATCSHLAHVFSFSATVFKSLLIHVILAKTAERDFHWVNSTLKPWRRLKCAELVNLFLLYRKGVTNALLLFTHNCDVLIHVYKTVCFRKLNSNQDRIRMCVVWHQFAPCLHNWIFFISSSEHTGTSYQWKRYIGLSGLLSDKIGCFQCINCIHLC